MMPLSPDTTVAQLVAGGSTYTWTLEGLGIRAVAGDGRTLREVCEREGLEEGAVLTALGGAGRAADPDPDAPDPLTESLSLSELCDQIVETHHPALRADLERLGALSGQVARRHGDTSPWLTPLDTALRDLADRLETHLLKVEVMLFPAIRHLEAGRVADAPFGAHLQAPLELLAEEHGAIRAALAGLRDLPGGAPGHDASPPVRELLDSLARLERSVRECLDREAHVLFPRALARFGTVGV